MDEEHEFSSEEDERQPAHAILVLNGVPIPIHLHRSLGRGGREAMANKIKAAGGDPSATEEQARVIICRHGQPIFKHLEFVYDHDRYKWVEPPSWVDECIMTGVYEHRRPGRMGNTRKKYSRVPFTLDDDEDLVQFLALRIPFKDVGGRCGNGVYKDLCNPERAAQYPWAARHPWQSWRERYIKNQDIFDARIAHAITKDPNPPKPGDKGQYVIPRKPKRPMPLRHSVQSNSDEEEEMEEEEVEEEGEEGRDGIVEAIINVDNKRPRTEGDPRKTRERRHPVSPPRKQPRAYMELDGDTGFGIGRDKGKGKQRAIPMASVYERPDDGLENMKYGPMHNDNEPGPSQFFGNRSFATPSPPVHKVANATPSNAPVEPSKLTAVMRTDERFMAPPAPHEAGGPVGRPSTRSSSRMPPDSQRTLVAPTQVSHDHVIAPPDTQVTTVPSSLPPQLRQLPPRVLQPPVSRNTRSRRRAEADVVQRPSGAIPPPGVKRPRGRPKKVQPSEAASLFAKGDSHQAASTSVAASASFREEVQVEEILQPPEDENREVRPDGDDGANSSSSESLSSEDDEATRKLRNASKEMVNQVTLSQLKAAKSGVATFKARNPPHIDISSLTPASQPSRRLNILPPPSTARAGEAMGTDSDMTPKAKPAPPGKAAKKTASRVLVPDVHGSGSGSDSDSESDLQSTARTETTDSSFPPVSTVARAYKNARLPFTPARGTIAEERVRDERSRNRNKK